MSPDAGSDTRTEKSSVERPQPSDATCESERTEVVDTGRLSFNEPPDFSFLDPPTCDGDLGHLANYRILGVLGQGGMGMVLAAIDDALGRRLAIKIIRPGGDVAARKKRFLREARAAASLSHERIVTIYQVGEHNGVPYLAMELLQGETLADRLRREPPPTMPEILRVARETAEGLAAAHAVGMIHRDVKPANIWLEAPTGRVKLLDFGLAYFDGRIDERLTESGAIIGTPSYLAPEQVDGVGVDARSDLFALGCTIYRCATLRLPFEGSGIMAVLSALAVCEPTPPQQHNPNIPDAVADLMADLLQKDPADRPATAREVVERIAAIEANRSVRLGRPMPNRRTRDFRKWIALAIAPCLFAGAAAWKWWPVRRESDKVADSHRVADRENQLRPQPRNDEPPPLPVNLPYPPLQPEWVAKVRAAAIPEKLALIEAELKKRNPGFEGILTKEIVSDADVRISMHSDHLTDLTPLSLLNSLRTLSCFGQSNGKLVDLRPLANLRIYYLGLSNNRKLTDLRPLAKLPIAGLYIDNTNVDSLEPMRGKNIQQLNISNTRIWDLSPLKDAKLTVVWAAGSRVEDISMLNGMPLERIYLPAGLDNLSPLSKAPIVEMYGEVDPVRDGAMLRSLPKIKVINGRPASEFVRKSPMELASARSRFPPADPNWLAEVALMERPARLEAIERELRRRNSRFKKYRLVKVVANDRVRIELPAEEIEDLTPLVAEPTIIELECTPTGHPHHATKDGGRLVDLWPIAGTTIGAVAFGGNPGLRDLTPLRKLPLTYVAVERTAVSSLEPLRGKQLGSLSVWGTQITSLEPVRSAPLRTLYAGMNGITDMSPIADKKLVRLHMPDAIQDFGFLLKMPLEDVQGNFDLDRDGPLLRAIPTLKVINAKPAAEFFKPSS